MKLVNVADPSREAAQLRKSTAIPNSLMEQAQAIIADVALSGDSALLDYTAKFDGVRLEGVRASEQEIKDAPTRNR